ncbi:MAG: FAD binding domain-containing protein [Gemmobacter sp.]
MLRCVPRAGRWIGGATIYARPTRLDEALGLLAAGPCIRLAGGTDLYAGAGVGGLDGRVLDLSALEGFDRLAIGDDGLRIGAGVTWSALARATRLPPALDALRAAAADVGGVQVQNAGTLAGNLCNASPAADGVPPLLVLDASVELVSLRGARRLPLADFLTGPRRTALAPDEVMTAIHIPAAALAGQSRFAKLGARRHLVISIAMVAVRLVTAGGRITGAAVSVGACSPVARRLPQIEAALTGAPLAGAAALVDPAAVAAVLAPIEDVRGTADYRAGAAAVLIARAVAALAEDA